LVFRLVLIPLLALGAYLAWHPQFFARVSTPQALITQRTHVLAPGVSLRTATVPGKAWSVIDFTVELSRARLVIGEKPGGGRLSELIPEGAIAAINGAFFEHDFTPHGWLIKNGVEVHAKTERSPHHVFAVKGTQVFGGHWEDLHFAPELALQNFPLLVEHGAARIVWSDTDNQNPRTFACDAGGGVVHLVVVLPGADSGPTLFDTAALAALPRVLGGFGCNSAVNLDGGPSSGYWVRASAGVEFTEAPVRIGHSLAIVPNEPE